MLQNATLLRKSAPGPPNISDEHVFCIAPATENASLQIPFNACHRFWKCYKTLALCSLLTRCTIPCACHGCVLFRHLNFQKCSEPVTCLHFWLRKVLRVTTACTFFDISTSVVRTCVFLTFWLRNVLRVTTACTFFDISTSVVRTCVFLTFWLRNVLRATTACTFSTSQLQWSERVFF